MNATFKALCGLMGEGGGAKTARKTTAKVVLIIYLKDLLKNSARIDFEHHRILEST